VSIHKIYAETKLPTVHGDLRVRVYRANEVSNDNRTDPILSDYEALAIISGYLDTSKPVSVRMHSACFTSEVLGSCKCDCKEQLDSSLAFIKDNSGVVIYLPQEGRGIGLADKLRVYALQEHGYDTIEANEMLGFPVDARQYDAAITILQDLRIKAVNLLTNNPDKIDALEQAGIEVASRTPVTSPANQHSASYLATKRDKMGHLI
jgi:3,4-dihydroxy 2-butanone 4-phosphate synthase/GTP cyclohydrolase II